MAILIGTLAAVALAVWLFGGRRRPPPAPEDDVVTGVDREALAEAERDLAADRAAESLVEDEEDDWGPGAP